MKTIILVFFITFSLHSIAQNDFRKMNWGDSPAELKEKYPNVNWESETEGNTEIYTTNDYVGGLDAMIAYYFIENKFQIGIYLFIEDHSSNNLYYEDFVSISTFLNKKYKMEKNESWNDTKWKGNDGYIGHALAMGDVVIEERYEDQKTAIYYEISGDAYIKHFLRYSSMDYVKSQRDKNLDDF